MEDWLPSQRSTERSTQTSRATGTTRTGVTTRATQQAPPTRHAPEDGDGRRQGISDVVTSKARAMTTRPTNTRPTRRVIRRDIMVRRVDPWSVLKISVVFYSSILIITMLANAIFWAFIARLGLIDQVTEIAGALNIALRINTGNILRATFLVGVLGVIFGSAVNVFFTFLYNLVSDLIGGIRVDLAEDE